MSNNDANSTYNNLSSIQQFFKAEADPGNEDAYQLANDDQAQYALIQMIQLVGGNVMVVQGQKIQKVEQACEDVEILAELMKEVAGKICWQLPTQNC
jgi:hypothetical protein